MTFSISCLPPLDTRLTVVLVVQYLICIHTCTCNRDLPTFHLQDPFFCKFIYTILLIDRNNIPRTLCYTLLMAYTGNYMIYICSDHNYI